MLRVEETAYHCWWQESEDVTSEYEKKRNHQKGGLSDVALPYRAMINK